MWPLLLSSWTWRYAHRELSIHSSSKVPQNISIRLRFVLAHCNFLFLFVFLALTGSAFCLANISLGCLYKLSLWGTDMVVCLFPFLYGLSTKAKSPLETCDIYSLLALLGLTLIGHVHFLTLLTALCKFLSCFAWHLRVGLCFCWTLRKIQHTRKHGFKFRCGVKQKGLWVCFWVLVLSQ